MLDQLVSGAVLTLKCRLRPAWLSGVKSPAVSKVMRVLVEGARSADPPINHGTFLATALSISPEAARTA